MGKKPSGQISVLAALMIGTTFFLFFAFVVNTGMVVHAKINLQNAADMAAYSGAATQARQLDKIGILNYELRRQFKKFLFRYYVLGTRASLKPQGNGAVKWGPNMNQGVPSVCVTFKANDNYCQLNNLPSIPTYQANVLDAIGTALKEVLEKIEQLRQANCSTIGNTNLMLLYLWLYKTEAGISSLMPQGGANPTQEDAKILATLGFLSRGLGLIPRNLIISKRINSLSNFVNQPAVKGLTINKLESYEQAGDPYARERTIQAFYSAYHTLGPKVFLSDSIVMDELLPEGNLMLKLKQVNAEFDTFATQQEIIGGPNGSCEQRFINLPVNGRSTLPVAVYKDPASILYYAVRLKASARVLLSPFGDIEMTAYAAAKPFGSRIGPETTEADWVRQATPTGNYLPHSLNTNPPQRKVPNLGLLEGDSSSTGKGWDNAAVITALNRVLGASAQAGATSLDGTTIERLENASMGPTLSEHGKYIIPADFFRGADPTPQELNVESEQFFAGPGKTHAFYAPLKDKESPAGDPRREIEDALGSISLPSLLSGAQVALKKGLFQYFGLLRQDAGGESAESYSVARITDPLHDGDGKAISLGGLDALMTSPDQLRSSWGGASQGPDRTAGRIGYSVKLVSFAHLRREGLAIDPETETVIDYLQH